jgi:hypothetical protein
MQQNGMKNAKCDAKWNTRMKRGEQLTCELCPKTHKQGLFLLRLYNSPYPKRQVFWRLKRFIKRKADRAKVARNLLIK